MEDKNLPTMKKEATVLAELKRCTEDSLTESQLQNLLDEVATCVYFRDKETCELIKLINYDKLVKSLNNEDYDDYY